MSTATSSTATGSDSGLYIVYSYGTYTSTTTRTDSDTTPVTIASTGSTPLVLGIAEDAYLGDAQFTVSVDGQQIGGLQTATALHSNGSVQYFTIDGTFAPGQHTVSVDFTNDALALYNNNTLAGDRNLYVDSLSIGGVVTPENVEQNLQGSQNYTFTAPASSSSPPPPLQIVYSYGVDTSTTTRTTSDTTPVTIASNGPTPLVLGISEDAYLGDAQFTVSLDGQQIGGVQTATALKGAVQYFTYNGTFSPGPHTISVNFLNDAVAIYSNNTLAGDRNLYVDTIAIGGTTYNENVEQNLQGTHNYTVTAPASTSTAPSIAITGQVLASDTGVSATDRITSNGRVTVSGTVSGASKVTIFDGTTALGQASIHGNAWSYTTTLAAGSHALSAVAANTAGVKATSATEPTILVETARPVVTIQTPVQTAGTSTVTLTGTVQGANGTQVQVFNGTTSLGSATVQNGAWSYTTSLGAGSYTFKATATDLAGNTATVADPAFTVTGGAPSSPSASDDVVLATVTTGTTQVQQSIDLSSPTPIQGTYVPLSPTGTIGASPMVTYNWNPATQLQHFLSAYAQGNASIVAVGDSTTRGFGSATNGWSQLSYSSEMSQALIQQGIKANNDNFLGQGQGNSTSTDNRLVLFGGATFPWAIDAGGQVVQTQGVGQGLTFTLNTPKAYNEVTVSYIDIGNGAMSVTGPGGVVLGSLQFGNTGQTLTQTLHIPAGTYSSVTLTATSANSSYIQGVAFANTAAPSISVYNAGIGGWDTTSSNTSTYNGGNVTGSANGFGAVAGVAALTPSLALVDLGINDINGTSNGGTAIPVSTIMSNLTQIVSTLQSVGTDVVLVIPQPFDTAAYATELPQLRTDLQAFSTSHNVPLIDLSATYGNSEAALAQAGLMSDNLHPDATLYADIGSGIAGLIANAITANPVSGSSSPTQSSGSNTIAHISTAAGNTFWSAATTTPLLESASGHDTMILSGQNPTVVQGTTDPSATGTTSVVDMGGTGSLTYTGGTKTASLTIGNENATVYGGSAHETVTLTGKGALTVLDTSASTGAQTITVAMASKGAVSIAGGSGDMVAKLGSGNATVQAGSGNTTLTAGTGTLSLDLTQAQSFSLHLNGNTAGSSVILGYTGQTMGLDITNFNTQSVVNGSTVFQLHDGNTVTLQGYAPLS